MTDSDPRPRSAVSSGVGVAGLVGLAIWTAIARYFTLDGPYSALTALVMCGVPMVFWSLAIDKVHRNPSTGIDWANPPRRLRAVMETSLTKLAGLWATWGLIAVVYCIGRWYWDGDYLFAMHCFTVAVPFLVVLSVPYILWLDRRLVEPRDGAFVFGQFLLGQGETDAAGKEAIWAHLRAWAVKGFFLAFMVSIVPGNFADVIVRPNAQIFANPVNFALWLIALMFMVDVSIATVGYLLTMRPLDAHIRSANPYMAGWTAALICYPPFVLMSDGGPLDYHYGTQDWTYWFNGHPIVLTLVGAILVFLTGVYAWATVAFGLRFSNLTHRGILTHGPYRWTKHPAYLSKNLFWWISSLPFLVTTHNLNDVVRNTATIGLVSAVYYWRARTEERHLGADPAYQAYAEWMERNAPIPRLIRWVTGKRLDAGQPVAAE